MLRPRGGSDFTYSDLEMEIILSDLQHLRTAGVDGFVFGALLADRSIDKLNCMKIIQAASPLPVTFHRAFDLTLPSALIENLRIIQCLGFKRLLTSGLAATALQGLPNICRLVKESDNRFVVMPGAGINVSNARQILEESGCTEFHGSGRRSASSADEKIVLINGIDFGVSKPSDLDTVQQLVNIEKMVEITRI